MSRLRKPMDPVAVSRAELEALWRGWRHFLRDGDMDIDPLAVAIGRLGRRLQEHKASREANSDRRNR